jgi:hypothetical protein
VLHTAIGHPRGARCAGTAFLWSDEKGGSELDVRVHDDGTRALVKPETDLARDWIRRHVSPDGDQPHWPTLIVEPRFLDDLLVGMFNDGLRVGV